MTAFIPLLVAIPLLGWIISLVIPGNKERLMSAAAFGTISLHFSAFLAFLLAWLSHGAQPIDVKDLVLFKSDQYEFFIDFCFDKITAVFIAVGAFLTSLITIYSRYYLHREAGYKRFFNTILFFYLGYNIIIFSGNLETLFVGWEFLGISSFLLIAFYRERYLPVRNAVKVFSIYRIGDIGLIMAMWLSHHLYEENITFFKLSHYEMVSEHIQAHTFIGVFIAFMLLVSAYAKSAQLPFSSWLPRAMEGPTPSSAIFYGSLSVHLGVFLMLRTYPFFEHQISVRIFAGFMGLLTSLVATSIARVQSSVKSQIAYASIAQIGLIFLEISLGWLDLALIHFAGNAFLRTYQLLVSPSVVSYLIREQFYNYDAGAVKKSTFLPRKWANTFYMLGLKEWNLENLLFHFFWNPLKSMGRSLFFLKGRHIGFSSLVILTLGFVIFMLEDHVPEHMLPWLPVLFAFIGLVMVLRAFSERESVRLSWLLVVMNHYWIALAVSFNEHFNMAENLLYLSGVTLGGFLGYYVLQHLMRKEGALLLTKFHGHAYEHPRLALLFFLCALAVTGFPITPSFIGEDVIFAHIHANQIVLAFFVSTSLMIDGLAIIRIYSRIFLGPHEKGYHDIAYKSS